MASIIKRKNGKFTVLVYWDKPYQTQITLSTRNKREAERVADYIQSLVDSHRNGTSNSDVENWLARLREADADLYGKLARLNLVKAVEAPKTLKELFTLFLIQTDKKESTIKTYNQVAEVLYTIFGESRTVESITTEDATRFLLDLKTLPLNRRNSTPKPYSVATVSKTIVKTKSIFTFAEQIGWVTKSPFRFLKSGSQVNPSKWKYVPRADVCQVIENTKNLKWKAIIALGRFAGTRGASEISSLKWSKIDFPNRTITIHALKKEAYLDVDRTVPMNTILFNILMELKSLSNETDLLFPGMRYNDNMGTMTEKLIRQAGMEPWPEPWYNLRRSFCSDVMEAGVDPKVYEDVCGHKFATGMKHYQILHPDRRKKGIDRVREVMDE